MSIKVITVGKKHEPWTVDGIERYQKRLHKPFDTEWHIIAHSSYEGPRARQEESERILKTINVNDFVILLDERGKNLSSPEISDQLSKTFSISRPAVIIIGGAYGVDNTIHKRADLVWSFSKLVFPHQLVRLILAEQIYRAQSIHDGAPYHHN